MKTSSGIERSQLMNNLENYQSVIVKGFIYAFLVITVSGHLISQQKLTTDELSRIEEDFAKNATARIKGQVFWSGKDISNTTVQVYKDKSLKEPYTGVTQLFNGKFDIRVEPGDYYLVAFVDLDRSGKFDLGDGMGVFGVTNWNNPTQEKRLISIDSYH